MLWDLEDGRVTATKESFAQVKEGIDAGELIPHLSTYQHSNINSRDSLVHIFEPSGRFLCIDW